MKKLFLILAIVSNVAHADTWVMPNNGGGEITITDRLCQGFKNIYYAYSYSDVSFIEGCWALMDGKVHIQWNNGVGRRVYELNGFVPDQTTAKKKGTSL